MDARASVPVIRGRAAEIVVLREALDRVASGRPSIVLIEGEAGIGKSRLLGAAFEDARSRGMQVVAGRAEELEQTRPFGLVAGAFGCTKSSPDPRRAAIAGLLDAGGADEPDPITVTSDAGLRFRAVDAFADLMEELALSGPLLIGVDDLQWADPSSLLTLAAVSRRLDYLPVALIGCFRPSPHGPELDRLADVLEAGGGRRVALHGLSDEAVSELVADAVSALPGDGLLAGISGAAGNPLFVTELLAALAQEGAIETSGGRADVAAMALPPTLRLTILRRLSFLNDQTLRALQAAAILGSGFTVTELSVTMSRPALELSLVLAEGIRGRVLEDDVDRLRFRHDLIRDAIYEDLPLTVRRGLHREAGQRLAAAGAPILQVAEQFARGAANGDAEAIGWLTRASREAAPTSPDAAADLLQRAIGLMNPADDNRDLLLAELASRLMSAGNVASAEAVCHDLLDRDHDPRADGPARICLGHALLVGARPEDALLELERVGRSSMLTSAERASGLSWASTARRWLGDLDGSAETAQRALSVAVPAGEHLTTAIAMASLAAAAELRGKLHDALAIIDDAVRLADRSPGKQAHRYPLHATRGFILVDLDMFQEARSALEADRRISDELGLGWHLPGYQMVHSVERFTVGEWDDAIAEVEASVELGDESGLNFALAVGRGILSLISLHRNELGRAQAAADAATRQATETGARYRTQWAIWTQALLLEADGRTPEGLATLAQCWDECTRLGLTLEFRMLGPDLVRLALACNDRGRAQRRDSPGRRARRREPGCLHAVRSRVALPGTRRGRRRDPPGRRRRLRPRSASTGDRTCLRGRRDSVGATGKVGRGPSAARRGDQQLRAPRRHARPRPRRGGLP